jgi:hypothetical protein
VSRSGENVVLAGMFFLLETIGALVWKEINVHAYSWKDVRLFVLLGYVRLVSLGAPAACLWKEPVRSLLGKELNGGVLLW